MNSSSQDSFLYINRENRWKDFHRQRLEISKDGTLKLSSLPLLDRELPVGVADLLSPAGPAGIAIGQEGTIYFSDPTGNRLLKIDGCDRREAPVPCMGGEGEQATQFREPRGLLLHTMRRALFVADSGNHRIQIFDVDSFQLLDIWGQKGADPGCFDTPWTLASDTDGNVYVVDYGNKRVQKFDSRGTVISGFWDAVQKSVQEHNLAFNRPSDVAVGTTAEKAIKIYILDSSAGAVFVFTEDGVFERSFGQKILQNPMGLAVGEDAIYVGDNPNNGRGHVFQFSNKGAVVGAAVGYQGPVAALALDNANGLWIHAGVGPAPIRLAVRNGYARNGFMWGGPFRNPSVHPQEWHRLVCTVAPLKKDAHLQLFVLASAEDIALPKDNDVPPWKDSSVEFAKYLLSGQYDGVWTALPLDVPGGVIPAVQLNPNDPKESKHLNCLWVGVEFSSEGLSSPELSQMRIDFDHETYLQYLPPIFSENSRARLFLARFLSLFESLFSEVEGSISNLATLFDSTAVPAEWLPWFAGWLAIDLKEDWDDAQKRQTISEAFQTYAWRGTAAGLRQALRRFAGVEARIEEPILNAAWWSLPSDEMAPLLQTGNSILGFTTMLAPAEAQGAVLGTTAILDQSHLITDEEFGAPLFEDVAHQFSVLVYRGQVNTDQKRNELCTLIDREKPAHTAYRLCIVEPRMRIGFQARVGIDTVVAGPSPSTRLGELTAFGSEMILGGAAPGRIGEQSRLGQTTRLSDAAVEGLALSPKAQPMRNLLSPPYSIQQQEDLMNTTESLTMPMLKREPPDPTRRNRFFLGKLMDAYHFELETNYLNAKRWLLNRLISGGGVVCGLDVKHHGEQEIVVSPGVAIDRWGREIIVQKETAPLVIPVDLVKAHAEWHKKKKRQEECCIHVVICYHECLTDPTPVLAGDCGCDPVCAPGAIRERYCIEFRPGCAPSVPMVCHFDAASRGTIDYGELVEWVTRKRRCLDFPKDPCIPLANFPVEVDSCSCCRGPEDIDITIRPIVFYNYLLFDLLYCLETEGAEAETE